MMVINKMRSVSFVIFWSLVIISTQFLYSSSITPVVYAHILSTDENSSVLEMFNQILVEVQLVLNNFSHNNTSLAQQHANVALQLLLNKNWTDVIADKIIVANAILPALNDLKKNLITDESKAVTTIATLDSIKRKVNNVNDVIDEFVLSHTSQVVLNNSTIRALVLAKILNDIDDSYGNAFGINKKSVSNNNNGTRKGAADIVSIVDYQTAQALAIRDQEIFNSIIRLKSNPLPSNTMSSAILELDKDFNQLRTSIDNKSSYSDIMTIIHGRIHPALITTYNLK